MMTLVPKVRLSPTGSGRPYPVEFPDYKWIAGAKGFEAKEEVQEFCVGSGEFVFKDMGAFRFGERGALRGRARVDAGGAGVTSISCRIVRLECEMRKVPVKCAFAIC